MNDVLIVGAAGQVAQELQRARWPEDWRAFAKGRAECDLSDPSMIAEVVSSHRWAAVINAGAYTAVDRAEDEVVAAWQQNALGPAALAAACAAARIPIIQLSTDYVFAGDKSGTWEVDDCRQPLGVYGASKLGGELAVASAGGSYAIVRTSWVVSAHGSNFVKTMLRLAEQGQGVRVVADQCGAPTVASDLAQALIVLAVRMASDPEEPSGTFHFSNAGATTWAAFAEEIFRQSAERGGPSVAVTPIATSDYPTRARRPANSLLSHAAIGARYGIFPRPWQEALGDILDELTGVPA